MYLESFFWGYHGHLCKCSIYFTFQKNCSHIFTQHCKLECHHHESYKKTPQASFLNDNHVMVFVDFEYWDYFQVVFILLGRNFCLHFKDFICAKNCNNNNTAREYNRLFRWWEASLRWWVEESTHTVPSHTSPVYAQITVQPILITIVQE